MDVPRKTLARGSLEEEEDNMTSDINPQQPQPQPQPQLNTTFHPFLRLPRELRDEVYKIILSVPPTSVLDPKRYPPSLNLSILRVNKQIHQEASEIFHTTAVFPIHIKRYDNGPGGVYTTYYITQDTLWDSFVYRYRGKYGELFSLNEPSNFTVPGNRYIHPNVEYPPIPRGIHFRKFKVEVLDGRLLRSIPTSVNYGSASRKLLLLVVDRLSSQLAPPTRESTLTLEIHLISKVFQSTAEEIASTPGSSIRDPTAKSRRKALYKDMVDTIWPLTQGPWKYNIHVPRSLEEEFPGFLEETLELCNRLDAGETKEEGVWREPTPMWYLWGRSGMKIHPIGGGVDHLANP
ncbi:hypothetical protein EYR41_010085 [Orbilia oligospora]|uniref:Uncharacterized protein n=1 Tax=Orbilia oligospora TaxID=2813651 RepID=A0A7C8PLT5_ORBOL|nr:hypothetical protein TWF751_006465 [Orbilia oligospora]TGJ64002.1 hypothetical protein EYR41_010085 [Orbilia oligospora]